MGRGPGGSNQMSAPMVPMRGGGNYGDKLQGGMGGDSLGYGGHHHHGPSSQASNSAYPQVDLRSVHSFQDNYEDLDDCRVLPSQLVVHRRVTPVDRRHTGSCNLDSVRPAHAPGGGGGGGQMSGDNVRQVVRQQPLPSSSFLSPSSSLSKNGAFGLTASVGHSPTLGVNPSLGVPPGMGIVMDNRGSGGGGANPWTSTQWNNTGSGSSAMNGNDRWSGGSAPVPSSSSYSMMAGGGGAGPMPGVYGAPAYGSGQVGGMPNDGAGSGSYRRY